MKIQQKLYLIKIIVINLAITIVAATTTTEFSINSVKPTGVSPTLPPVSTLGYDDFDDYVPHRSDVHDYFSWELFRQILQEEENSNVIISPFSIKLIVALLTEAAGNNTQTQRELTSVLTDITSPDNLRGFYKKTLNSLKKENPIYTLNLETNLFTDMFIEPQQRYAALIHDYYHTNIQRLEFANSQESANIINTWSKNVTNGHIQKIVSEESIQNSVMLLINVIYFKGLWRREFNNTFKGDFFKTPLEQTKVNYMQQTGFFYYYDSRQLDAKILRLPYKGKKFSMFILLPNTKGGIHNLAKNLINDHLKRIQWTMEEVEVKVTLPKFKFDFNKNMKESLQLLGIREIFTDSASLPGLDRGAHVASKLKVSSIIQKAGIVINEHGTEAFAATVVHIENKFGGNSIVDFNVNRPFIFFIEEEASGNVLFAGKVHEPLA